MRLIKHTIYAIITAAASLATISGCGSGNSTGSTDGSLGAFLPTRDPAPSFNVTVATDKATYKTGDPINITVSVTNIGTSAHSLAYPTGEPITHWGYIIAQSGKIVAYEYNSHHRLVFTASIGVDQYAVNETRIFNYVFPYSPSPAVQPITLPPGTYQVYARQADLTYDGNHPISHTTPTPASDPVTITVTP